VSLNLVLPDWYCLTCVVQVTQYLGYSSLKDFFPTMDIKPNPGCINLLCGQRQAEWAVGAAERAVAAAAAAAEEAAEAAAAGPLHDSNDWGIEVMPDAADVATLQQAQQQALPEGLQFSMPSGGGMDDEQLRQEAVQDTEEGLDDLMAQLEQLSGGNK
jgi:ubiquitin-like modifier-activating enzyme 5